MDDIMIAKDGGLSVRRGEGGVAALDGRRRQIIGVLLTQQVANLMHGSADPVFVGQVVPDLGHIHNRLAAAG